MLSFALFEADPCTNSPCYNGFCSGFENGTFSCMCNSGYTGQLCDLGKTQIINVMIYDVMMHDERMP